MVSLSAAVDLSAVPKEYQELGEAFSKDWALSLPPYHPYDCCIELLPGALLPSSHLYNLSSLEQEAKERYVSVSLAKGLIRPSSHVRASFFFVQKKDGSLRSCINYHGLNQFRIKNKYPLPLHDATFSLLNKARSFTKLNLRKECHFVWIHQGNKWKAVLPLTWGTLSIWSCPLVKLTHQALVNIPQDMLQTSKGWCSHFMWDIKESYPACSNGSLTTAGEKDFHDYGCTQKLKFFWPEKWVVNLVRWHDKWKWSGRHLHSGMMHARRIRARITHNSGHEKTKQKAQVRPHFTIHAQLAK